MVNNTLVCMYIYLLCIGLCMCVCVKVFFGEKREHITLSKCIMGRSAPMCFPIPLNEIRWDVVLELVTPSSLVQNSDELVVRCNPCGLHDFWSCWELNFDRLAFIKLKLPVCMPWSHVRAVGLLLLGYPLNRKLGGSRAILDVLEKRHILWPCYNWNTRSSVPYPSRAWPWGCPCEVLHLAVLNLQSRVCESLFAVAWVQVCFYFRPPNFHLRIVPVNCQGESRLLNRKAAFAACNQHPSSVRALLGFQEATDASDRAWYNF